MTPAMACLVRRIGRRERGEARAFRYADQDRLRRGAAAILQNVRLCSSGRRVVRQGAVITRFILEPQRRRARGEALQVRFGIESDDEEAVRRQYVGDGRPQVDPSAVTARDDDGIAGAARSVQMEGLRSPPKNHSAVVWPLALARPKGPKRRPSQRCTPEKRNQRLSSSRTGRAASRVAPTPPSG